MNQSQWGPPPDKKLQLSSVTAKGIFFYKKRNFLLNIQYDPIGFDSDE
jgi:hypothetical protein